MSDLKSRGQSLETGQAESETIKVLLIEDNPGDARLVKEMLLEAGTKRFSLEHASCIREGLALLSQKSYHITLLDLSLPDGQGLDTIHRVCPASPHLPVIILTGLNDETIAIRAVHEGAQDYLVKGQMNSTLLVRAIRYAIERKRTEEVLREEEDRLRQLFDEAPVGYHEVDREGRIVRVNQTELEMLGYSVEEMVGKLFWKFMMEEEMARKAFRASLSEALPIGSSFEHHYLKKDHTILTVLSENRLLRNQRGEVVGLRTTIQDITDWKRTAKEKEELEQQFRQSQKMEAIGLLAGGIAHDFNNLLTVISGYSQMALGTLKEDDHSRGDIQEIKKAAERAANLTRQLLAFSRCQVMEIKVLDLNLLLGDLEKMLKRILGEDIELLFRFSKELFPTKADAGQMEQVVLNLAINARDAMPHGGKLTIETANVELDETYCQTHRDMKPGQFAMLSVSDTGIGMSPDVKERIFEPFFTTKEVGRGTGLGLSTAYGIVRQSGGCFWVYSEPDHGTTFKIYLPRAFEKPILLSDQEEKDSVPPGKETVLLVEDDPLVRSLALRILQGQGYKVLEAANGEEALKVVQEKARGEIHLLLTDVVMPKMGGKQLVEELKVLRPEIKILFTSGYTNCDIVHRGILESEINFLPKPFSSKTLSQKVREVLKN